MYGINTPLINVTLFLQQSVFYNCLIHIIYLFQFHIYISLSKLSIIK